MAGARTNRYDVCIGARVRALRVQCGLTQKTLAENIGVTFQQLQKYEKGINRISAGRLYEIAQRFGVPIGHFFQELEQQPVTGEGNFPDVAAPLVVTAEAKEFLRFMAQISSPVSRKKILRLLRSLDDAESTSLSARVDNSHKAAKLKKRDT